MDYLMYNIIEFKESIECDNLNCRCRKREKDFSRNRKLAPKDLIYTHSIIEVKQQKWNYMILYKSTILMK